VIMYVTTPRQFRLYPPDIEAGDWRVAPMPSARGKVSPQGLAPSRPPFTPSIGAVLQKAVQVSCSKPPRLSPSQSADPLLLENSQLDLATCKLLRNPVETPRPDL
jgi:hypothetical protein